MIRAFVTLCVAASPINVEVDGRQVQLLATPSDEPLAVAERFCREQNLTDSIEGLPCVSTITEELIQRGARHRLPHETLLVLTHDTKLDVVPRRALGPGELRVPVDDGKVREPLARLDLDEGVLLAWTDPDLVDMRPRERFGRAAAAFCIARRCSLDVAARASAMLGGSGDSNRVVLSMSTLPSRIAHVPSQLRFLREQSRPADAVYLVVPYFSTREQRPYEVPEALKGDDDLTLLRSKVDWGPATKLIPVLAVETHPTTLIITVDDDVQYPSALVAELVAGANRHPDSAVGFRGYRFNGTHHDTFVYVDSADSAVDVSVDALGGLTGAAYRSGFFDVRRLIDYSGWSGGAFYVDDDWISLALDEARVRRVVLGASDTARKLRDDPVLAPHHALAALNAPSHAFRNIAFQAELLEAARARGAFKNDTVAPCHVDPSWRGSFDRVLEYLEARVCGWDPWAVGTFSFVVASDDLDAIVLLDRFLQQYSGTLHVVAPSNASLTDRHTSDRTSVIAGDPVHFLWNLRRTRTVDLLMLDGEDPMGQFAAALGSSLVQRGHTVIVAAAHSHTLHAFLNESLGCFPITTSSTRYNTWLCY